MTPSESVSEQWFAGEGTSDVSLHVARWNEG